MIQILCDKCGSAALPDTAVLVRVRVTGSLNENLVPKRYDAVADESFSYEVCQVCAEDLPLFFQYHHTRTRLEGR